MGVVWVLRPLHYVVGGQVVKPFVSRQGQLRQLSGQLWRKDSGRQLLRHFEGSVWGCEEIRGLGQYKCGTEVVWPGDDYQPWLHCPGRRLAVRPSAYRAIHQVCHHRESWQWGQWLPPFEVLRPHGLIESSTPPMEPVSSTRGIEGA